LRILFVLPYGPSEIRVRSRMLIAELTRRHEITLVALAWDASDLESLHEWSTCGVDVRVIPHGVRSWAPRAYRVFWQPFQQIVATSPGLTQTVRALVAEANATGRPFDVLHIEHLRGASAADLNTQLGIWTVFDAVDCISELARLTWRHNPAPLTRLVAWREEQPTRRLERTFASAADVTTVVAQRDADALRAFSPEARIEVIPNGVRCLSAPLVLSPEPVVVFTGKLSYHANQAAIRWFIDAIWPMVLPTVPDARLVVAGADPPGWLVARSGSQRVTVLANPPEMQKVIASARVAIAPMPYSVGIQNKILEAMAAGLPVVATAAARGGLNIEGANALLESSDASSFAANVIRLLIDDQLAQRLGQRGYDYVRAQHSWQATAARFESLYALDRALQWTA